jgi:hypothetical protein
MNLMGIKPKATETAIHLSERKSELKLKIGAQIRPVGSIVVQKW